PPPSSPPFPYTTLFRSVLRNAGNALDICAAVGRVAARWVLVRRDRRDARNDHEPDEGDNDDLVAPGHLAGGRLPSAPERYRDERSEEHTSELQSRSDLV